MRIAFAAGLVALVTPMATGCKGMQSDAAPSPSATASAAAATPTVTTPPPPATTHPPVALPVPTAPHAGPAGGGPCAVLAAKCSKCTLPFLKQTCMAAVASGDPKSCQEGLNDKDVESNCK
jgi:hypothetical protein